MHSLLSDPLLTIAEVGRELGKSRATIFLLLKETGPDGTPVLPSVKIGQSRRVRRSDLEAYIADLPVVPGGNHRADPEATPGSADSSAHTTT